MAATDKKTSQLTVPVSIADTDVATGYRPGTGGAANLDIQVPVNLIRKPLVDKLGRELVSVFDFFSAAEKADVLARTQLVDVRASVILAQNALTTVGGGTLVYPAGDYRLSSAIPCQANIRHLGVSKRATRMYNVGGNGNARLNDMFNLGATSINNIGTFTGYAGTLAADRASITLTTSGAGSNFSADVVQFIAAATTVNAGAVVPDQGFFVYISDVTGDVVTFAAPIPETIASPSLFKQTGTDSSTGYAWHVVPNVEVGNFTFINGSIHVQGAWGSYIHDLDITRCRNAVVWNTLCRSVVERISATYWNRALELKLYSHESTLRDMTNHWYNGGGGTTPTTPISFGEMCTYMTVDNFDIKSAQLSAAAGYVAFQYCRHIKMVNSRGEFYNMPAAPVIDVFDGLSTLARCDDVRVVNCDFTAAGSVTRFARIGHTTGTGAPSNITVNSRFNGTVSSLADAIKIDTADVIDVANIRLPSGALVSAAATATNVLQTTPAGLAILPIRLADGMAANTRTALGTSAAVGVLGVGATYGAAAVTRSIASATTSEAGYWWVRIPDDYAAGGTLKVRLRCNTQNAPAAVSSNITISAKRLGDNSVGAELYSSGVVSINSATSTDYDLTFASTAIAAGDAVYIEVTIAIDNTGGGSTVTGRLVAIKLLYQSVLKGR